jgi:hypothetical protein
MAEIPVKTLIITNLKGSHLVDALTDDENYFPCLKVVRINPEVIYEGYEYEEEYNKPPYDQESLSALEAFCKRRNVVLKKDARKTMSIPRHF